MITRSPWRTFSRSLRASSGRSTNEASRWPQALTASCSLAPVIPGMRPRKFPAGEYLTPCALIIGTRKESTDKKTSLNSALRDFGVSV